MYLLAFTAFSPWQPQFCRLLYRSAYPRHFTKMEPYRVWLIAMLLSLLILFSRFIDIVAWISISFIFIIQ